MQTFTKALLGSALGFAFTGIASAQGDCSTAVAAALGATAYDNSLETSSGFDGGGPCSAAIGQDLFFSHTIAATGTYTIDLCGASNDTRLAVHLGVGCAATCVVDNDDSCGLQSSVTTTLNAGDDILIQVGGFGASTGPGVLNIALAPPAPANDTCATPAVAVMGANAFDSTSATDSTPGGLCGLTIGADLFYTFTAPADGDYTFDTCGSSFDTEISVSAGADCSAVCIGGNDDGGPCTPQSTVDVPGALSGDTFLIRLGGWNAGTSGLGSLNIGNTPPPPPVPSNDTCATPDVIGGEGVFAYDRTGALSSGFDGGDGVTTCLGAVDDGAGNSDVFFAWTPVTSDNYNMDVSAEGVDTEVNIHLGADCAATCLMESDPETFTFGGAVGGTTYLIQIGSWNDTTSGTVGALSIVAAPAAPANDTCATPDVAVLGANPFDSTSALDSGFQGAAAGCTATIFSDVFWTYTIPADDNYIFDTCGSGFDTEMSVYLGSDCLATCIGSNDDGGPCSPQSTVDVVGALAGEIYLIQVGGWNAGTNGVGVMNVSVAPPTPSNDTCATPLGMVLGANAFDNTGALSSGFDGGGPCSAAIGQDVFYTFTAGTTDQFQFDTCGSGYDTRIAVHLGSDCLATCIDDNDDTGICGALESAVDLPLNAGDTVLIQVGGFGANFGPGVVNISVVAPPPPPPANNDCSTPDAIGAEGAYAFNNEFATTSGFDGGDPVNCMSPVNVQNSEFGQSTQDLFWAFTVPCDGDYSFDTAASPTLTDTRLSVHLGADCSATCVTSNDDIDLAGGNFLSQVDLAGLVSGDVYLIQVGMWNEFQTLGDGVLTITNTSGPCPTNGIIEFACQPSSPHGGGGMATLVTSTFVSGQTPSGLNLQVTDGSPSEFGFFLISTDHTGSLALFNGVLCLDSPQGRYNPQVATNQGLPQLNSIGQFDGAGVLQSLFGNAPSAGGAGYDVPLELPFSPAGQLIAPGDVYAFQCWYRDGASANFSDSIKVLF